MTITSTLVMLQIYVFSFIVLFKYLICVSCRNIKLMNHNVIIVVFDGYRMLYKRSLSALQFIRVFDNSKLNFPLDIVTHLLVSAALCVSVCSAV